MQNISIGNVMRSMWKTYSSYVLLWEKKRLYELGYKIVTWKHKILLCKKEEIMYSINAIAYTIYRCALRVCCQRNDAGGIH